MSERIAPASARLTAIFTLLGTLAAPLAAAAPEAPQAADPKAAAAPADPKSTRQAYESGDCETALPGLQAEVARQPQRALAHYQLGFCLERGGHKERAAEHKKRAAALFEKEAASGKGWEPYYYLAALSGLDFQDPAAARTYAQEGMRRLPAPASLDGVACFQASRLAGFAEMEEEKVLWMSRAAESFAAQKSPPAVYAVEALLSAGDHALQAGENEKARDWLERVAELSPMVHEAWLAAGIARLRLGDAAGALADFRRVTAEPMRTEAQYAVRTLERAGDVSRLPDRLPDGRPISALEGEEHRAALRSACAGEWKEASHPTALALLLARLRRGEFLRESAIAAGCLELLFR